MKCCSCLSVIPSGPVLTVDGALTFQHLGRAASVTVQVEANANPSPVSQITSKQGTSVRLTTTRNFDFINRLSSIVSVPSSTLASTNSSAYLYNNTNQRTRQTMSDGTYWVYGYDTLGQVTSGKRYWSDGTPVAGQQFEYTFDDIGNRTQTKAGGDSGGANLRTASRKGSERGP
jgi:hypothetical protein